MRRLTALLFALLATGCATTAPPVASQKPLPAPPGGPAPASAGDLDVRFVRHDTPAGTNSAALDAFRAACQSLGRRDDRSGLTQPNDWAAPCAAAMTATEARTFFSEHFTAIQLADGRGFATGYFEPEIAASRTPALGYATAFYRRPVDLVEADLGAFRSEWKGRTLRGRLQGNKLVPYHDRSAIAAGALKGQGLELAYAGDANEAFFLEIQGSGRLRLPDGSIMRIGYDGQNGRDYVAIGKVLLDRGDLPKGGVSMDSILAWMRAHPDKAPALRAANPSLIFFRELTELRPNEGPIGAMGHPLTPGVSAAVDPAFTPLGAPLIVERAGQPPALQIAADTGGAIRGAGRIDMFKGPGAAGAAAASNLASPIRIVILLPRSAAARLLP